MAQNMSVTTTPGHLLCNECYIYVLVYITQKIKNFITSIPKKISVTYSCKISNAY